ncbi:polinucleotide kinase [Ochrobactrum phage vB_OspM_OC]|nr:polinucleotide kinase [Ochrobactrum phage vB_OspM_OC]
MQEKNTGLSTTNSNKRFIMLICLPATGKSSYRKKHHENDFVISTDDMLMALGKVYGIESYSKCFGIFVSAANEKKTFKKLMEYSLEHDVVVLDRTNLKVEDRKTFIDFYKEAGYRIEAVYFNPSDEAHKNFIASRPDKRIPDHVYETMREHFVIPDIDEGFDEFREICVDKPNFQY